MKSSEERLIYTVSNVIDDLRDELYPTEAVLRAAARLEGALAASEETDMERLREWIGSRRKKVADELGMTNEAVEYQDGLLDAYEEIVEHIADQIGVGQDANRSAD